MHWYLHRLPCSPWGNFGYWKSLQGKGTFVPLPWSNPQKPQQVKLDCTSYISDASPKLIHGGSLDPERGVGYDMCQCRQSHPIITLPCPIPPLPTPLHQTNLVQWASFTLPAQVIKLLPSHYFPGAPATKSVANHFRELFNSVHQWNSCFTSMPLG